MEILGVLFRLQMKILNRITSAVETTSNHPIINCSSGSEHGRFSESAPSHWLGLPWLSGHILHTRMWHVVWGHAITVGHVRFPWKLSHHCPVWGSNPTRRVNSFHTPRARVSSCSCRLFKTGRILFRFRIDGPVRTWFCGKRKTRIDSILPCYWRANAEKRFWKLTVTSIYRRRHQQYLCYLKPA